ncbi:MAG: LysE family transporter [Hyphomicrobiaceae bacterium]
MAFVPNVLLIAPVGFLIGVLVALPLGPTNLLALQRAVERGFFGGLAAGLGVMLGDGLIALAAALGVNAVSGAIKQYRTAIQIVGGVAIMVAGLKLYFTKPTFTSAHDAERATLSDYIWDIPQLFLLTLTNPGAVLGLFAIFSGVSSFVEVESHFDALAMVASVMGGSFTYWLIVSRLISGIRHIIDEERMSRINQIAGLVLLGLGSLLIGEMGIKRIR